MEGYDAAPAEAASEKASIPGEDRTLPAVSGAPGPESAAPVGVFRKIVAGDDDIVGLVGYALYKQNKIDWMAAFEKANGRAPNAEEFAAYIVGENTSRRIATYRFLAESTIARSAAAGGYGRQHSLLSATLNIFYGLLGVAAVAAVIVLLRFFISMRH